jgi:hypothetical protein
MPTFHSEGDPLEGGTLCLSSALCSSAGSETSSSYRFMLPRVILHPPACKPCRGLGGAIVPNTLVKRQSLKPRWNMTTGRKDTKEFKLGFLAQTVKNLH